jgi:hypothetical protein
MQQHIRAKALAMVHIAAKHQGLEQGSEDYRAWLQGLAGVRSCRDLTDGGLAALAQTLKQNGLTDRKPLGGTGIDRPSLAQWRKLETLARQLGFANLLDTGFITWIKRVTGLDNPRFLTAQACSDAICGLERWIAYRKQQEQGEAKPQTDLNKEKSRREDQKQ